MSNCLEDICGIEYSNVDGSYPGTFQVNMSLTVMVWYNSEHGRLLIVTQNNVHEYELIEEEIATWLIELLCETHGWQQDGHRCAINPKFIVAKHDDTITLHVSYHVDDLLLNKHGYY